ncbi:beta-galactosidase [Leisingera sp.]|uniref:beta-galactosidase n=1 Tax=Leisingera sp. TaxID=1879318 RepID=UPI003A941402
MKRTLGACYYPEHWPEEIWAEDAARMAAAGLTWIRIGEFSWSKLEPTPGELHWDWLDRAIETLGAQGLKVVLGTPTATPPRWIAERHPDMFAVDEQGRARGFGSRRHYCFSHKGYLEESRRITRLMAERYGDNPHVAAWQTDNEYGCHDTVISYSDAAKAAFRDWLREAFDGDIGALNTAWGNVFWSMEYRCFDEIGLPNLTVTEPNPAHVLAFKRFSSDQVVAFNRAQAEIIREFSNAPVSHNYMGRVTEFDHFKVGKDLEIATWDSYPLGFLEDRVGATAEEQRRYARQGDPDFQALHHDLYRAVGRGRWWVMEQQPGPVNWAPYNPSPLPGMVRLWTWEAFAHGAEAVCYFRWRQAPFAQEQMHAGLLRPDSKDAPAIAEARQVAQELGDAPEVQPAQAPVAILFDYDADWAWSTQPHGAGLSYFQLILDHYKALRRAGQTIDILPPDTRDFTGYKLILAPGLMHMPQDLKIALAESGAEILYGPRSGARDGHFSIPTDPLPPALPGLDVTVSRVESLRPDMPVALKDGGATHRYLEELEGRAEVVLETETGAPVALREGRQTYCGGWLDAAGLDRLIAVLAEAAGLALRSMPEGVRTRRTATEEFWFNHRAEPVQTEVGLLPAAGVLRRPF